MVQDLIKKIAAVDCLMRSLSSVAWISARSFFVLHDDFLYIIIDFECGVLYKYCEHPYSEAKTKIVLVSLAEKS
jgi:hypothetical protein